MSEFLSLFFPTESVQQVRWFLCSDTHEQPIEHGLCFESEMLPLMQRWREQSVDFPVQVFVPGEWVSVWTVPLPKGAHKQMDKILPVLLEEELTNEIENLHFAVLEQNKMQATVAVIQQQRMQQITQWLNTADIQASILLPDWAALPEGCLSLEDHRCRMRRAKWQGFSSDPDFACHALTALFSAEQPLTESEDIDAAEIRSTELECITVYTHTGDTDMGVKQNGLLCTIHELTALGVKTDWRDFKQLPVPADGESTLMTGAWRPRQDYRQQWLHWRPVIFSVTVVLALLTVERAVAWWSMAQRANEASFAVEQRFRALFPQQTRIVNLRAQLAAALRELEHSASDDELLVLLPAVAQTLESAALPQPVAIVSLRFDQPRQELRVKLSAPDFAVFDALRRHFATRFITEQGALLKENDRVTGELTLKGKPLHAA
ncbi:MAG: type II secretion system protein GspL [Plesiomonas shigelloides]